MLSSRCSRRIIKPQGFTLIELLISISILGVLLAIGVPSLSEYMVQTRVDSQIAELHRLVLTARNTAINSGKNVTICPLSEGSCTGNWKAELSVFTNEDDDTKYDAADEDIVKVKGKVESGDTLKFNQARITYTPTGRLVSGANSLFSFCPSNYAELSRGVSISLSGRIYTTQDTDNDGKDEDRDGNEISCS
ncbi:GspH/FimT family pseudopilin [Thalassotalea insulae]|nr:GspH/FimT family pseudopilin [Thalassotalea insulae]